MSVPPGGRGGEGKEKKQVGVRRKLRNETLLNYLITQALQNLSSNCGFLNKGCTYLHIGKPNYYDFSISNQFALVITIMIKEKDEKLL